MCAKYDDFNNEKDVHFRSYSYVTVFGIFLTEFLLSSLVSSYGIFYSHLVESEIFTQENAIWTPILFVSSLNIANPWARHLFEYFEDVGYDSHRNTFALSSLILSSVVIIATLSTSPFCHATFYGILGGLCASFIYAQMRQSTYEDFQAKPLIFDAITEVSKACSLLLMPHFIANMLVRTNIHHVQLIFSSILLHIIPAGFLIKKKKYTKVSLNRYKTFEGLYDQDIELPTISTMATNSHYDSSSSSSSEDEEEKNTKNIESDQNTNEEFKEAQILDGPDTSKPTYPKAIHGFDILPKIPEEDELTEDSKISDLGNGLKRYSKISSKLDVLIATDNLDPLQPQLLQNFGSKKILEEHRNGGCFSPYQNYLLKKRVRTISEFCFENLWKPFWCSLRNVYFFPSLLTKLSGLFVCTVFVVTIPYVSVVEGLKDYKNITLHDSTFLLTVVAFAWLFFLVALPRIFDLSKTGFKILFMGGLIAASFGLALLTKHLSHDALTLSCLVYGFSYGILSFTEEIVFREVIGLRQWKKVQGTLETTSGFLLILLYFMFFKMKVPVTTILSKMYIFYTVNVTIWIFITVLKRVSNSCHDRGSYLIQ